MRYTRKQQVRFIGNLTCTPSVGQYGEVPEGERRYSSAACVADKLITMDDVVAISDRWEAALPKKKVGRKPRAAEWLRQYRGTKWLASISTEC